MTTDEHAGNPFAVAGRWYRGNLHTHSTNSDGRKSVEDAVGWYRDHGYDFMALTDHRVLSDTSALTTDDFITIPGMEMHGPDPWLGVNYHIVGLGMHSFERSDEAWGPPGGHRPRERRRRDGHPGDIPIGSGRPPPI